MPYPQTSEVGVHADVVVAGAATDPAVDARAGVLARRPASGDRLLVQVAEIGRDGAGIALITVGNPPSTSLWRFEVPAALPGEQVEVVVGRAGRRVAETRPLRWLVRSAERVAEPCGHAGPFDGAGRGCGGCVLQHLTPKHQRALKMAL